MNPFILSAFSDEIDEDLEVQVEVLGRHRIRHMEIRNVNGKNVIQYTLEEVRKIKERLVSAGIGVSAVGSPIGKIGIRDDFKPHLELFKHTVETARILDTRFIRMFSFFIPSGENPGIYRDEVMERWNRFVEAASGSGLVLLHENEKDIYGDTAERCLDLMQAMNDSQVRTAFDPANFVQCDVKVFPEAYALLKDYIVHYHIKDALYRDHQVVPAGMGDGHVEALMAAANSDGYRGFLTLEPHLGAFKGLQDLERNTLIREVPGDGPSRFALAVEALTGLLDKLGLSDAKV